MMPRMEQPPPARPGPREMVRGVGPEPITAATELSDDAIRAIEEGRADHAAGRTFTIAEIKRELGLEP